MNKEQLDALWLIVLYVGALAALIAFLRTLFVPPRGGVDEKDRSPFQIWLEFSRERAEHELNADLEKYRIDKGLAHQPRDFRASGERA